MTNISEGQRFKRYKIARIDKFIFNKKRKKALASKELLKS